MLKILILLGGFGFLAGADQDSVPPAKAESFNAGAEKPPEIRPRADLLESSDKTPLTDAERSRKLKRDVEEICGDIFPGRRHTEVCEGLPLSLVFEVQSAYDILKSPSEENLNALSSRGLEILLDVSPRPLERVVDSMNRHEKNRFITYLAGKPEVVDIIQKVDEWNDYEISVNLFEPYPYGLSSALTPLVKKTLQWEQETMRNNHEVWKWIDGFAKERFCSKFPADANKSLCALTNHYCQLSLTKEEEVALMQTGQLESVLDEVLKEHRPEEAPDWWTRSVTAWDLYSYKSESQNVCALLLPKAPDESVDP